MDMDGQQETPQTFTGDAWHWRAHYTDGTSLEEYDATGQDHGFAEVELSRLVALELMPQRPWLPTHFVLIDPTSGVRPIFFRRRLTAMALSADGTSSEESGRLTAHVLGHQQTITGRGKTSRSPARNVASFTVFLDNGSSFTTTDRATLDARLHLIAGLTASTSD